MEKKQKQQKGDLEKFPVSQKAIIYDPETKKFLLVRYADDGTEFALKWSLIGGRINKSEDVHESFEREIIEEAGDIQYEIKGVVDSRVTRSERDTRCSVGYLVYYLGGSIELNEEHVEYAWKTNEDVQKGKEYHDGLKQFIQSAQGRINMEQGLDGWRRCQAEFENYKKSKMNLEKDMAGRAVEDFAYKLLPVIDNFHASTDHIPEDQLGGAWVQGILYIQKQLEQVLSEMDVVEIEAREGDKFDPNFHEAVKEQESPLREDATEGQAESRKQKGEENAKSEDKIQKVLMRGYKRGERVIRAARVVVI